MRRVLDGSLAGIALLLLAPLLGIIAVLVRLSSPGPALFRQTRVGVRGSDFTILKFRTMRTGVKGSQRSAANDHRITRIGRMLRRHKLDELPQLVHVLSGKMSLIGPRPKLRDHNCVEWRLRPGVTGAASVAFAAEELLLRDIPSEELETWHRAIITPHKVALDLHYAATATFWSDLRLLCMTLFRMGRYHDLAQIGEWQMAHPEAAAKGSPTDASSRRGVAVAMPAETAAPASWQLSSTSLTPERRSRKVSSKSW